MWHLFLPLDIFMSNLKKMVKHAAIAIITLVITIGTLFISRPVEFPDRKVKLGYPIYFGTLDFDSPYTSMGGAPESYLRSRKFNILSSWEEHIQTSWGNFAISYTIIFLAIEAMAVLIDRTRTLSSKN